MTEDDNDGGAVNQRAQALFSALDELVNWLDEHGDLTEIRVPEGLRENARSALLGAQDLWDTTGR